MFGVINKVIVSVDLGGVYDRIRDIVGKKKGRLSRKEELWVAELLLKGSFFVVLLFHSLRL